MKYVSSRIKMFTISVIGLILFLRIIPFLLQKIVFPLGLLETIIDFMLPILMIAFVLGIINALRVGQKFRKKQIERDLFLKIAWAPICAIILGFVVLMFCDIMKSSSRILVKRFLEELPVNASVTINDKPVENSERIITELEKIALLPVHRSHTIRDIHIEIYNQGKNLSVVLGRDSSYPNEYWIFYPNYRYTSKNDIGGIVTNVFDDY
ncbi:MAG: hypothetical protein ABSB11_09790 [Sedimentisphaerales bacterium]